MLGKGKSVIEEEDRPMMVSSAAEGKTIIGEHISIEGNIKGKQDLVIEGSVKGKIELEQQHVTVGSKGQVEAEIHAEDVTISGELTGNITAQGKVAITKDAHFDGEIKAKGISVEDGAYLKAVIELEPKKKATPVTKLSNERGTEQEKVPVTLGSEAKGGSDT
ncbi:MAG: polymer-forming cytoskeletal protein [Deltaproteobacteria bacterium]